MKFEITKEQLQEIGNYLYAKPMNEVENLVAIIRNLKEIKEDKPGLNILPPSEEK